MAEMDRVSRENWMKLDRVVRKARLMPKKYRKPKRRTGSISKPIGTFAHLTTAERPSARLTVRERKVLVAITSALTGKLR